MQVPKKQTWNTYQFTDGSGKICPLWEAAFVNLWQHTCSGSVLVPFCEVTFSGTSFSYFSWCSTLGWAAKILRDVHLVRNELRYLIIFCSFSKPISWGIKTPSYQYLPARSYKPVSTMCIKAVWAAEMKLPCHQKQEIVALVWLTRRKSNI